MLGQYQAGKIEPVSVTLGELPVRAGGAQRAVVEHMRLLMGLRRAYGDDRPLPYATSVPVAAGLVPNQGAASQILRSLVRYGVIDHVGALPPLKPGLDGTKLYAPPGGVRS